jgi:hypothetical protein
MTARRFDFVLRSRVRGHFLAPFALYMIYPSFSPNNQPLQYLQPCSCAPHVHLSVPRTSSLVSHDRPNLKISAQAQRRLRQHRVLRAKCQCPAQSRRKVKNKTGARSAEKGFSARDTSGGRSGRKERLQTFYVSTKTVRGAC